MKLHFSSTSLFNTKFGSTIQDSRRSAVNMPSLDGTRRVCFLTIILQSGVSF
jgi:hypothetical protein